MCIRDRIEYYLFPKVFGLAERAWNSQPSWALSPDGKIYMDAKRKYNAGIVDYLSLIHISLPKIHIGFGNTFVYKDFDLDVFMYGQFGRTRYNYAYRWALVGDVYYLSLIHI